MNPQRCLFVALSIGTVAAHATTDPAVTPRPSFSQPALSPDSSQIAFISGGAIWSVAASGGAAHLLIADKGSDSRPLYSPDGRRLAFVSTATGNGNIYVLDLAAGSLTRITYADTPDQLDAWSRDGQWLYFSSTHDNVGGMQAVYRVRSTGGTPMPVSLEAYRNESQSAPSPDGRTVALIGGGMGDFQWWRHGRSHIDEGAVWLLSDDGSHHYARLTPDDARADWPMWAADGRSLYYMSDRSRSDRGTSDSGGAENIWHVQLDGSETALTHFIDGRVLWPTISADGHTIAFERDFGIWTVDVQTGQSHAVAITLAGAVSPPADRHETLHKDFTDLALSPDGKKLVVIAHGDVYATDTDKGGQSTRVTQTPGMEYDAIWAPDSHRIVYGSERGDGDHLYLYDFVSSTETQLTDGASQDTDAAFSADGKSLAFLRDGHSLCVLDLFSHRLRILADAHIALRRPLNDPLESPLAWSPDGRWIAYLAWGDRMFRNAWAVAVADGKQIPLSFLANTFAANIAWNASSDSLLFVTAQRTEQGQVASVDLLPRTPKFRENQFLDLFKEATPSTLPHDDNSKQHAVDSNKQANEKDKPNAPPKAVQIEADGIRERLDLLPIGLDVQSATPSPDGKTLLITAQTAGKTNLYAWSLDPLDTKPPVARQLTSSPGNKLAAQFSADSKTVFYLDDGIVHSLALAEGSKDKVLDVGADVDIDFGAEKQVSFNEAWTWLRDNFHDPKMHGVDWNAVRSEYAPLIAGAPTPDSLLRLLNLMVGELDASHSGVRSGAHPVTISGRLGLQFDRAAYEQHSQFRVAAIVPLSPADVSGKIHVGDFLLAVDRRALTAGSNLDAALADRIGYKTTLRIAADAGGRDAHDVEVKPIDSRSEGELAYAAWVERNRAYVEWISHGRLGYAHLRDMSMDSLQRFYKDLDAQNSMRQGVVIDERNNFGGFVNAYALDVLSRRPYLDMTFRGFATPTPARSILGQRALERPTVLITNRVTLSDGEDFSEGYRALGLGKVVGEPTAGWIIYTSNEKLIDGSSVRLPFITITTADGKPMELHPRPVDVPVARPLGEAYQGKDSDLDAAVGTLLQQIDGTH